MLLDYYGLREEPFGASPDLRYLYMTRARKEALAALVYGIETGRGFLSLVGAPGTGKTTLLFQLLNRLQDSTRSAFLFAQCDPREFLRRLLTDLGIAPRGQDLAGMHVQLKETLLSESQAGRRFVGIIDEAQNLEDSFFETVRLLSNIETPRTKLLQIILAGRPRLADKLASLAMAQLRQRISIIARLDPLTPMETGRYIDHRLRQAGYRDGSLFTLKARTMISAQSQGIPSEINNLCTRALTMGYAFEKRIIDSSILREVIAGLEPGSAHRIPGLAGARVSDTSVSAALPAQLRSGSAVGQVYQPGERPSFPLIPQPFAPPQAQPQTQPAQSQPGKVVLSHAKVTPFLVSNWRAWGAIPVLLGILAVGLWYLDPFLRSAVMGLGGETKRASAPRVGKLPFPLPALPARASSGNPASRSEVLSRLEPTAPSMSLSELPLPSNNLATLTTALPVQGAIPSSTGPVSKLEATVSDPHVVSLEVRAPLIGDSLPKRRISREEPKLEASFIAPLTPRPITRRVPEFLLDRTFRGHSDWVTGVAFSPDGRQLVSGSWDRTVKFWDVISGQELGSLDRDKKGVQALAFSRDGRWLAVESSNNTVTVWDAVTEREIRTFPRDARTHLLNDGWVYSIAFSPDGRWLASGVNNKTVRVWEVKTGSLVQNLTGLRRPVIYIAFSPDSRWLASGGDSKTIKIWDVATGQEVRSLSGHKKDVYTVAFSADGRWLASGGQDRSIKLWDVVSGREIRTLSGHRNSVTSLSFSPDGEWLASGSWDDTVKVWNVETGREVQTLIGHTDHVYSVAFGPQGRRLASGSEDGTIKLWRLKG